MNKKKIQKRSSRQSQSMRRAISLINQESANTTTNFENQRNEAFQATSTTRSRSKFDTMLGHFQSEEQSATLMPSTSSNYNEDCNSLIYIDDLI